MQLFNIQHPANAGNRHEGQHAGHHQKQQVVSSVNRSETQQDGNQDKKAPALVSLRPKAGVWER